jgi:hypothetical protein
MSQLSDGQKARIVFSKLAMDKPHLLMLDEPTNHLDMESIDSLARMINDFKGGLVLVSHDMRLISQVRKAGKRKKLLFTLAQHSPTASFRCNLHGHSQTPVSQSLSRLWAPTRGSLHALSPRMILLLCLTGRQRNLDLRQEKGLALRGRHHEVQNGRQEGDEGQAHPALQRIKAARHQTGINNTTTSCCCCCIDKRQQQPKEKDHHHRRSINHAPS